MLVLMNLITLKRPYYDDGGSCVEKCPDYDLATTIGDKKYC